MQGFHSLGDTPTAEDGDVAASAPAQPLRLCPLVEHVSVIRLPKKRTAFTDAALRRELLARIESARPPQVASTQPGTVLGSHAVKPIRWCGASPLERKRAAWRERRRASR